MNWFEPYKEKVEALFDGTYAEQTYVEGDYVHPHSLRIFMWGFEDLATIPSNWNWAPISTLVDVRDIVCELHANCAVVGVDLQGSETMQQIAVLDALYGIALQQALAHTDNPEVIDLQRIYLVGQTPLLRQLILWRQAHTFLTERLVDHFVRRPAVVSEFLKNFDLHPGQVGQLLQILCVAPNLTLLFRTEQDAGEVVSEVKIAHDCGYANHIGWWRVQSLLRSEGSPVDLGVDASDLFVLATEIMDFLLHVFQKSLTENVWMHLYQLNEFNKIYTRSTQG